MNLQKNLGILRIGKSTVHTEGGRIGVEGVGEKLIGILNTLIIPGNGSLLYFALIA